MGFYLPKTLSSFVFISFAQLRIIVVSTLGVLFSSHNFISPRAIDFLRNILMATKGDESPIFYITGYPAKITPINLFSLFKTLFKFSITNLKPALANFFAKGLVFFATNASVA